MYSNRIVSHLHSNSPRPEANILIDRSGRACLADFNLITITSDQSTFLSSCVEGGTIRWMSPELLHPGRFGLKEAKPTRESDCYALGMVTYAVLGGQKPYAPCEGSALIRKVLDGERPGRPRGDEGRLLTDGIWRPNASHGVGDDNAVPSAPVWENSREGLIAKQRCQQG